MKSSLLFFLCSFIFFTAKPQTVDSMVDVGTHRLNFQIMKGQGTPILFESGNGDDGAVWADLLQPIHDSTGATLITYDRAGLGKSEIDTAEISFKQEIRDLERALKKLGFSQPVLLVSHSFGGFYSTEFARRNKKMTLGAVFIDVALPCYFTAEWSKGFVESIKEGDWAMIKQYKVGLYYVLQNLEAISEAMKPLPRKIPVTVIGADIPPAMVKPEEVESWKGCLKSFGSLPNHKYVLAPRAGHKVWADNPDLVIREVTDLYRRITLDK